MVEVYVLFVVLALATAFGLWRRRTDGRIHEVHPDPAPAPASAPAAVPGPAQPVGSGEMAGTPQGGADDSEPLVVDGQPVGPVDHTLIPSADVLGPDDLGEPLGERATLLQFSSAFCTPCRATRVVLGDVAGMVEGVRHIEVDAESHLDLVRRLDITRTPTVLVLDADGRIRSRATGAPRKADVVAALGRVV
jgi:thiol-disulfide isomerase/thioredoxin